jgi:hypothetical protein
MGYEVPETRATLVLDDEPYVGAEIEVSLDIEWGAYKKMRRLAGAPRTGDWRDRLDELIELFLPFLRGWNLERNGVPLPPTAEGVARLGPALIGAIIGTWVERVGMAGAPLGNAATSSGAASGQKRGRSRARKTSRP